MILQVSLATATPLAVLALTGQIPRIGGIAVLALLSPLGSFINHSVLRLTAGSLAIIVVAWMVLAERW